ncbi:MAG: hypothetical protein ACM336_08275 [Acidobacteriota bacterium]
MIARGLAIAAVACSCALAQLQLTEAQTGAVYTPDTTIDLSAGEATLRITNVGSANMKLERLEILSAYFGIAGGPVLPLPLAPKASVEFRITLTPAALGTSSGWLTINQDYYFVFADVTMPAFRIEAGSQALASGQQANLTIRFAGKAPLQGNGLLRMDFTGKGDPAIAFLGPGGRSVPFTIEKGEDIARFSGETSIGFQTGTTAGTIIFTATLGEEAEQAVFQLAPSVISMDQIRGTRAAGELRVAVSAFDNTRTASKVKFKFFDSAGRALGSGEMAADVTAQFRQYFEHPELGGMFVLRATFPVTGDTSQVDSVEVELANSAGASRASAKMTE